MIRLSHIALWTNNLERSKNFYCKYFGGIANDKYNNASKGFESYFISFGMSNCRLELMHKPELIGKSDVVSVGFAHIAIAVGSREQVLQLTETLRNDGFQIMSEPRTTGDGYFESVVADPDGNWLEITE